MGTSGCPYHVECEFHNSSVKTPSDAMLKQFFCDMRQDACEIARRFLEGKPIPIGACPDGNLTG
jgi:hypothetical protein